MLLAAPYGSAVTVGVSLWLRVELLEFWLLRGREDGRRGWREGERTDLFLYVLETNE